jgi:Ino eighty subunit 2
MSTRRSRRNVPATNQETATDIPVSMSRARRNVSSARPVPLAKVSRQPLSSPSSQQSLHLTVKLPASKLRQATGMAPPARAAKPSVSLSSREQFVGGEIIEGKRARNVKKSYVLESDSEDEEDEEMEDVAGDNDAEGESVEEEEEEEEDDDDDDEMADQDAEGEDDDADGDVDMDIPPPPPIIKISRAEKGKKPTISMKPTGKSDSKTVEAKEAPEVSDDEELSELDSEVEEEEEGMQLGNEEEAEGEEEEDLDEIDDDEEEEDDELDSDDETPAGGSRASTPDLTKLTKRQRARLEEGGSGHLLALPDGASSQLRSSLHYTNSPYRSTSQEAFDSRGACHASCRDGSAQEESE